MAASSRKRTAKNSTESTSSPSQPAALKKRFNQILFHDWCKACGICMAFCPVAIIEKDKQGKPVITDPDKCIGCRFCELHCPDFAITIEVQHPLRRKTDGVR